MQHNYFVYILTNIHKTTLYTGVTNDLQRRLNEHLNYTNLKSFTSKYNCNYIIYFERFQYVEHAIQQEKRIKGWSRKKKEILINDFNPNWTFLNNEINDI